MSDRKFSLRTSRQKLGNVTLVLLCCLWATLAHCDDSTPDESIYQTTNTASEWPKGALPKSLEENPLRISLFDPQNGEDKERLWSQTKLVFGLGVGVAGFIAMLPPEISNWDRSDDKLLRKWWDNVSEGPVWDRDVWYINYIGHPYFGGVYYQVARKSGYRQWDSFMYSFMMSTFYWEYGLEAFAEVPSVQDLVVTPVGGWLWGEWSYQKEKEIRKNGGTVYESYFWGDIALFLLDPVDTIGAGINNMMGREVVKAGTAWVSTQPASGNGQNQSSNDQWSLNIAFQF
ncbi:hypothetical protein A3765_14890 [Oleiphilus sp. HI0130]|nr:hypothetical protein A3758_12510 [Oleiphilus sp. HI0118]KZZ71182.1 hypothetical protein A3765_14890 [Oleiphilus sp. HI0130]